MSICRLTPVFQKDELPTSSGLKEVYPGRIFSVCLDTVLPVLKVEAGSYSETSLSVHEPTHCQNPLNSYLNSNHYEILKICIRQRLFKLACILCYACLNEMTVPDFYNLQFKLHLAVSSTHIWVSVS
jgi:hypothetical protein